MHGYLSQIYTYQNKVDSANYYLNTYVRNHSKVSLRDRKQFKEAIKVDFDQKIKDLKEDSTKKSFYYEIIVIGLITIVLFITFLVFKNTKEKKKAKKKLNELLSKISKKEDLTEKTFSLSSPLKIKDEQHQQIISGLLKIEEKKYFLKEEFNLYNAAKKIGTNTTYLSK